MVRKNCASQIIPTVWYTMLLIHHMLGTVNVIPVCPAPESLHDR